ncbi:coiled-coil domain-containing protein 27 [Catharus ustulatus]|uniref:coiled-coil domain-containing protein 27 n=1 Tax=Catharus ustulatus TaxID=91951 RepID=UPI00140C80C0|nr:coiled-coil domain-containing protein 27 [Catharus ustulatus]
METDSGSQEPELTETMGQLQQELRKAKDDHNMAIGAISSLQRQMEIQESEIRRMRSEKDLLQKQLRDREDQIQAVFDKFCSLTEEQRQEEVTAMMEEENLNLQKIVTEQESQLAEQNKLISELEETISQLRAEAVTTRLQLLKHKQTQKEMQSQAEALQHKELQTRVALEQISSKFERYRNKVIQAVFSAEGSRDPVAELTDNEVLEAMQKIINECQRKRRNKGSKVSLQSSDSCAGSPAVGKRRNSIRSERL